MPTSTMSPGMAGGIGIAGLLGGSVLDYIGQRQGAAAMEREANRQSTEQGAFSEARAQALLDTLGQINPRAVPGLATGALQRRMSASQPALRAGGRALGLSGSSVASSGRALMPAQRVAANQTAQMVNADRTGQDMRALRMATGRIADEAGMAARGYDARLASAGQRGAGWRLAGTTLEGLAPLIGYAMAQPEAAPVDGASGISGDWQGQGPALRRAPETAPGMQPYQGWALGGRAYNPAPRGRGF